jgi:hypothetical protein
MRAELIARALERLAEDPLRGVGPVARELGVQQATLALYLSPGGACRNLDKIMAFPDYAEHADSIHESLRRLGQSDQADELLAASRGTKRPRLQESSSTEASDGLSAQRIFNVLTDRIATGKSVSGKSMDHWTRAAVWKRQNLADRLAKQPDYAQWRDRIEPLAKQLGLIAEQEKLPEPKASKAFDAHTLAAALRLIRQRQQAKAEDRLDDPSLTQSLHGGVGVAKGALANWVAADGTLRKPPASIAKMPGYAQERDEIRRLLEELGHADVAAALPEGPGGRQQIGAKAIAQALAMIAENPQRPRGEIALAVGMSLATLLPYIGAEGAQLEKIAALPGYAAHVDSIRESLQRMGRQDQVAALPLPQQIVQPSVSTSALMPAHQLVDRATSSLNKVVAVAELLRKDPPMSIWAATESVGVSRSLIRALLDEHGAIRDQRIIEQSLANVDAATSKRLAAMLARLAERLDPTPRDAADEPPLKRLVLKGAGTRQADRVLLVDRNTVDPGPGTRDRKEAIYSQNPSLVHEPRSYEHDRQRQPLRWLSTMLKERFPRAMEVQCYYDRNLRAIVIAGNTSDANTHIQNFVASGDMERMLAEEPPENLPPDAERTERHRAKLLGRMNPVADPHETENSSEIFAAMAEGRFIVPQRNYRDTGTSVNVHAERRIFDFLRDEHQAAMDHTQLAGTMRPCGTCAGEICSDPEAHRGPFWMSKAARAGLDGEADIDQQASSGIGTSITRARDGRLTFQHDTDSDSDA